IRLLEEAYRASRKHPSLRFAGPKLLDAYQKAGKSAEAIQLLDEVLADVRKQFPKDSPQLSEQLASLGLSLLHSKAFTEAEPLLRETLAMREKRVPNDWRTFIMQSLLGESLLGQKKYADAEPLLLRGYEGLKQRENAIPKGGATYIREA